jgi:hypothetical protein
MRPVLSAAYGPLYAETSPVVNSSAASHTLLLSGLPLSTECLSVYFRGVLSALKCPRKWGDVLAAMLSHLNPEHNWVWAGVKTLAAESSTSDRTVKRVTAWARAQLGLRVVQGDELSAGPGPHRFVGERRGDLPVNTTDLGPLVRLLPASLVEALRAVLSGAPVGVPAAPEMSQADYDREFPDPFVETDTSGCNVLIERTAPKTEMQVSAKRGDFHGAKNGPHNIEADPTAEIKARPVFVRGRKPGDGPGFLALRALGVWAAPARRIVAEHSDKFALQLAAYASWAPRVQDRAKYARVTARDWVGSDDNWPLWFEEKWRRAEARSARTVTASPVSLDPVVAPLWGAVAPSVLELDDLPIERRRSLLKLALEAVLRTLPEPMWPPVLRGGYDHPMVRGHARLLLSKE